MVVRKRGELGRPLLNAEIDENFTTLEAVDATKEPLSEFLEIAAPTTNLAVAHNRRDMEFSGTGQVLNLQTDAVGLYPPNFKLTGIAPNGMTIIAPSGVTVKSGAVTTNGPTITLIAGAKFALFKRPSNAWVLVSGDLNHNHEIEQVNTLSETLIDLQHQIDAIVGGGSWGTFLDPMWSIATGPTPGTVVVSISSFPNSTRPVESIGYLMDGIGYSAPIAASFTIQTNTPGASESIAIRVEQSTAIGGEWSEPKSATAGAAVAPSAFENDDWNLTPGSGSAMATVELLSLPYNGGATISAIEIQYNSTGSWISIGGVAPGVYNVAATGISGAATGRLRAVNAVGNGAASPTKAVTIPGGATVPATFGTNQWALGQGTLPGSVAFTISALPGNGGSAFTAMEYTFDAGVTWTPFSAMTTGTYQITGFAAGQSRTGRVRMVNAIGPGTMSASKQTTATAGSVLVGGTVTEANGFRVHTLTADGSLTVHGAPMLVNYEFCGGGGGGGYGRGGGGGGAELKRGTATLAVGVSAFVRGAGGVAASVSGTNGGNGGDSTFAGVTALGGGGGAGAVGTAGNTGGSGGGGRGGEAGTQSAGGTASGSNTNAGGAGSISGAGLTSQQNGGGGGGAGSAGGAATTGAAGVGGNGSASTAPGVATIYCGGGGGIRNTVDGQGGLGGNGGTTGGQGAGGTGLGNLATAGQTPGSGGGGGLGGTRLPAAGKEGILHVWYPLGEVIVPADVIVTTPAQLTTALNAVPSNLARRYIIGLASGFQGWTSGNDRFTYPSNYNKGTTCVQIRSEDRLSPATFRELRAQNSRNVEFEGLEFINPARDVFGFPGRAGSATTGDAALNLDNSRGVAPWYVKVRNCYFDGVYHAILWDNATRARIEYTTIRGYANDGIKMLGSNNATNPNVVDVVIDHCYISPISARFTFPDVTEISYNFNRNNACDPRRSDEYQRGQNSTITDLNGVSHIITTDTKGARHCDAIQSIRTCIDFKILDTQFVHPDAYTHIMLFQTNNPPPGFSWDYVPYSTGFEMRRCSITASHSLAPGLVDFIDPILHTCLWRRNSPTHYTSGNNTTYPAPQTENLNRSNQHSSTRVRMTDCVLPANLPTGDWDPSWVAQNNVVFSNTAVPPGWASTDVALGKVGAYGYEN